MRLSYCNKTHMSPQLPLHLTQASQSFDTFYAVGNDATVKALQQFVQGEGEKLLYVYGPAGAGKTHLLKAVATQSHATLLSGEALDLSLIKADAQCVIIDDIDAALGLHSTALFNLFNHIKDHNLQLLVSASTPPQQLNGPLNDLQSRLQSMLVLPVNSLSEDDISQAIVTQAHAQGLALPAEVLTFLMKRIARDMSVFSAVVTVLSEASMIEQRKLTVPFVKRVLHL
jgi:DnaA family protein